MKFSDSFFDVPYVIFLDYSFSFGIMRGEICLKSDTQLYRLTCIANSKYVSLLNILKWRRRSFAAYKLLQKWWRRSFAACKLLQKWRRRSFAVCIHLQMAEASFNTCELLQKWRMRSFAACIQLQK
jgi:hypothetical protein